MEGLEKLVRAVEYEFRFCPAWKPVIARAREELAVLQHRVKAME